MRFNKQEMLTLATQPSQKFDKEGVLFLRERQDGLFRRSERECYYFLVYYIRNTIDLLGVTEVSFSFFFYLLWTQDGLFQRSCKCYYFFV